MGKDFRERLKGEDILIMFNIVCMGRDFVVEQEQGCQKYADKVKRIDEEMSKNKYLNLRIAGSVFLLENTDKTRLFTFIDETYPLTEEGLEDAENTVANFYNNIMGVTDDTAIIYSNIEGEFINKRLIANATEYITLF